MKRKRKSIRKYVDKRIFFRLQIFAVIFVVMLGIITYDIFQGSIAIHLALIGILVGIIVGLIAGRMFNIRWHEEKSQVITHVDELGVAITIAYMTFSFFRNRIFSYWLHAPVTAAFTFSFLAGSMLGRLFSIASNVKRILHKQGL